MKAILVIDMPTDCSECPCYDGYWQCGATGNGFETQDEIYNQRADWCPLRPMPHRKVPVFDPNRCDIEKEKVIMHEIDGWNACLEEIGEEE